MMDIVQSFRRLSQKLGNEGWNRVIDTQTCHYKLLKKLYLKNGLDLIRTSCACPEQYDVLKNGNKVAYFRLRHGEFTIDMPTCGGEEVYEGSPDGDGAFEHYERFKYLTMSMRLVLSKLF